MHSIAARIALLAYVVGGMAMPVMHRHDSGALRGAAGAHGHADGAHSHSHAACHHGGPSEATAPSAGVDCCADPGKATAAIDRAPAEHAGACSDNCVVCSFAGSPQSAASPLAVALAATGGVRVASAHTGPGFEALASRHNRLRGPPISMILG